MRGRWAPPLVKGKGPTKHRTTARRGGYPPVFLPQRQMARHSEHHPIREAGGRQDGGVCPLPADHGLPPGGVLPPKGGVRPSDVPQGLWAVVQRHYAYGTLLLPQPSPPPPPAPSVHTFLPWPGTLYVDSSLLKTQTIAYIRTCEPAHLRGANQHFLNTPIIGRR